MEIVKAYSYQTFLLFFSENSCETFVQTQRCGLIGEQKAAGKGDGFLPECTLGRWDSNPSGA